MSERTMGKSILFVTCDGGGNVPPTVGIAAALARQNRVRILAHESQSAELAAFDTVTYSSARPWSSIVPRGPVRGVWDPLMMFSDNGIGRDTGREIERQQPDVVVIDFMLSAALTTVRRLGVPYVVLGHTLYDWMTSSASRLWFAMAAAKGHRVRACWQAADVLLMATDPVFDAGAAAGEGGNRRWVGPVVDRVDPAHVPPPDGPVLVSLSSNAFPGQREVLDRVLAAAAGSPRQFVVTTGDALRPQDFDPPPNVRMLGFVPHEQIMPEVSMLVGHGGHATTMRALAYGLPVVALPLQPLADQPRIARALDAGRLGAGLHRAASPEQIRATIDRVADDHAIAASVRAAAARIRAADAADRAAEIILAADGRYR